jgi:site-specific DNA-adenine methylase
MTYRYEGNGEYLVWLESGIAVVMSENDMKELQDLEFTGCKTEVLSDINQNLVEKIVDAKEEIQKFSDELDEHLEEKNLEELKNFVESARISTVLD